MKEISLTHGGHRWDKKNLVTQEDRKGQYDLLRCKFCGIEGKRYSLDTIQVYDRYVKKIDCCPKAPRGNKSRLSERLHSALHLPILFPVLFMMLWKLQPVKIRKEESGSWAVANLCYSFLVNLSICKI